MKCRIIPKEYEYIEYIITNWRSVMKFVGDSELFEFKYNHVYYKNNSLRIGDHILKNNDGEFIIVDPYTFKQSYEKVEDK